MGALKIQQMGLAAPDYEELVQIAPQTDLAK